MKSETIKRATKGDFIRRVPLFSGLSEDEIKSLEPAFQVKTYRKNQVIFLEEDTGEYMYVVLAGQVKITKSTPSGRETLLAIHQPGDYFGEMSLLDGQTRLATVSAKEDCKIAAISRAEFHNHLMRNQKVVQQIVHVLCMRLRQAWSQIQALSFSSADTRIRDGIYQLSQRHGIRDARGILINVKITHQELAEMFGTSRETVTRALLGLQKKGIIKMDSHRIVVLDSKRLLSPIG